MPTYQYRCTECDTELEAVQKFSDDPLTICPECQGRLRKVFSAVGVVFKGSGFYRTDNQSGSSSTVSSNGSKESGSESKDDSAKESSSKGSSASDSSSGGTKESSSSGSSKAPAAAGS